MNEEYFVGVGGRKLFSRSWRPDGPARGIVVLVHGFKAHSGVFSWAGSQLAERGFAAFAPDLPGHGRSDGERYKIETATEYSGDVGTLIALVKSREPGIPVFLLGHSEGGVIAVLYALDYQDELTGLICESFAHEVAAEFTLSLIKGLSKIAPNAHVLGLKDDDFSRDPNFVEAMKHDPLIPHMAYPSQTVAAMALANERLKREFSRLTVPLLILHGTADKVARPSGSQLLQSAAGSLDKTLILYDGHFHDLLNDLGREKVLSDLVTWLENRLPTAAFAERATTWGKEPRL